LQIPISRRAREVKPFYAMEIMERAKALEAKGREVIYLCLGAEGYLRFSYASSMENLENAMNRLESYLNRRA
jgi:aspartate/methionine/tyrosine aminotransferase